MSTRHLVLALATSAALASCGDDAGPQDTPPVDTPLEIPPAPQLGMQIDRMGRPLISGALVGTFRDPTMVATMKKDDYNQLSDPSMWATAQLGGATGRSVTAELVANLGILDVLDKGNPSIPGTGLATPGCKNQLVYNATPLGGGNPGPTSYDELAALLADDMVLVDTAKATCTAYFALELEYAQGGSPLHQECGGRAPTHDVIDFTYSALIAGLRGFVTPAQPRLADGAGKHGDASDTVFPYFGAPR